MKVKNSLIVVVLSFSTLTNAETLKWVKNPFWTAPQKTSFEVRLSDPTTEVRDNCSKYSKLIFGDDGRQNWPDQPERIERYRNTLLPSSPMTVSSYETSFLISTSEEGSTYVEEEVIAETLPSINPDSSLPGFTQARALSGVNLNGLRNIDIKSISEGSLTKVSRDLGLDDSKVMVTKDNRNRLVLKVHGRDVACDLLSGRIELTVRAPGYVKLESRETHKMNNFYHGRLEDELNRIIGLKDDSVSIKSAYMGMSVGRILDEEFSHPGMKTTEKRLRSFFELAFLPKTLTPSGNLTIFNKRATFNLPVSMEAGPVVVEFKL